MVFMWYLVKQRCRLCACRFSACEGGVVWGKTWGDVSSRAQCLLPTHQVPIQVGSYLPKVGRSGWPRVLGACLSHVLYSNGRKEGQEGEDRVLADAYLGATPSGCLGRALMYYTCTKPTISSWYVMSGCN